MTDRLIEEFFAMHFRQTEDGKSVYLTMTSDCDDVASFLEDSLDQARQDGRNEERDEIIKYIQSKEVDPTMGKLSGDMMYLQGQKEILAIILQTLYDRRN